MPEYGFSLARIFPYKDRIVDFVFMWESAGQKKPRILAYFTAWKVSVFRVIVVCIFPYSDQNNSEYGYFLLCVFCYVKRKFEEEELSFCMEFLPNGLFKM